jgi:D-alanyl-D-alanine carboxypeptidase (penicillin-binding protein 5/6)
MLRNMKWKVALALVAAVAAVGVVNYLRPIPAVMATSALHAQDTVAGAVPKIPWPSGASGAIGAAGLGLIATSGNQQPVSAASVTKVMTALVILTDKPLKRNESGPTITITDTDVQSYLADQANKESVVIVQAGEQLTELQLLEGLLIPSANNFAHTTFTDTSGASPKTVSTPSDLMALGVEAMKQEVFAQIVRMAQADLPIAGLVYNVDAVLGQSGIIGIKTGSGLAEGANFLFAADATIDGQSVRLYGCVMGLPTLARAFAAAKSLIASMQSNLHVRRIIARNQVVATYATPWGGQSDLLSTVDVDLVEWPGMIVRQTLDAPSIVVDKPIAPGTREGTEHVLLGDYVLDVELVTASSLYPPGRAWRLTRINFV